MPEQSTVARLGARPATRPAGRRSAAADFLMLTTMYAPPRLPRRPVLRERLIHRVAEAVRDTPLTLVSAPAGSGKTTLAASWVEHPGVPWRIVWLTLSEASSSPGDFWFFLTEALSRAGVDLPHTSNLAASPPAYDALVTQLATDLLNRAEPVVLVLDEVERITDPEVLRQLDLLLRLASVRIRLVLLSRVDPMLPMQRYRLTGTMAQIRMADLAFTLAEARDLLSGSGIDLPEQTLEVLHARTEGWAAGLQLAALAREHWPAGKPEGADWLLGAQDANLAEYLIGEILGAQPAHLRDFLMRTSVVDPISAELAEALTGEVGAAMSLVTLVHHNILMEADGDLPGCYHAHPLFRELLRAQLAYESPELLPELLGRAAAWYARAGMADEAVTYYAAAGRWDQAAAIVVDGLLIGDLLHPARGGLARRIAAMPSGVTAPEAAVVRAALSMGRADVDGCTEALDQVAESSPVPGWAQMDVAVEATRLAAAVAVGDHEAAARGARWLEESLGALPLEHSDSYPGNQAPDLHALLWSARGIGELHRGDLRSASGTFSRAVTACVAAGLGGEHVANLGRSALTEALQGHLRHALELVDVADQLLDEPSGGAVVPVPTALALAGAWAAAESGQPETALARLAAPRVPPEPLERLVLTVVEDVLRSRIDRSLGRPAASPEPPAAPGEVPDWMLDLLVQERVTTCLATGDAAGARRAAATGPQPRSVRGRIMAARADLAVARDAGAARRDVDRVDVDTVGIAGVDVDTVEVVDVDAEALERQSDVPVDVQVEAWLAAAAARLAGGRRDQAVAAVQRAVRLARTENLRRPFDEATRELRHLWGADARLTASSGWIAGSVAARPPRGRPDGRSDGPGTGRAGGRADGRSGGRADGRAGGRGHVPASGPASLGMRRAAAGEPIIVDALSARETEVLRHLADLLTTEEVAEAMFVSVNTVKSHIRSILRKLSVGRRNEAIRRARELNVI